MLIFGFNLGIFFFIRVLKNLVMVQLVLWSNENQGSACFTGKFFLGKLISNFEEVLFPLGQLEIN